LVDRCEPFLDFSFPHFIVETYSLQRHLLAVAHMLCFFPTELQFMGSVLARIEQQGRLGAADRFLLCTLHRVFVTL
jgi:hypothetical protein